MDEQSENVNKELENIKNQKKLKNIITNKKYIRRNQSRLDDTEEWNS